eukprot:31564_1
MSEYLTEKLPQRVELLVFGYIRTHINHKTNNRIIPFEIKHLCGCFACDYDEWDDINSSKDYIVTTDKRIVKKRVASYYTNAFGTRIVTLGEIYIWTLKVIQCDSNTLIIGIIPSKNANSERANLHVGHRYFADEYSIDISNGGVSDGSGTNNRNTEIPYSTNGDIYKIKLDLCKYTLFVKRNDDAWVVFYDSIIPTSYKLAYSTYWANNGFEIMHQ